MAKKSNKIDMSECVFTIDEDSKESLEDIVLDMFVEYVNNNSQFIIERKTESENL